MKRIAFGFWSALAALAMLMAAASAQDAGLALGVPNGGFEQGMQGWKFGGRSMMAAVSQEQAATGRSSLKITDNDDKDGSDVTSSAIPLKAPGHYTLHGKAFPVSGSGLGIYLRLLDRNGRKLPGDDTMRSAPVTPTGKWVPFTLEFEALAPAAFVQIWIHSYGSARVAAYLDDFSLVKSEPKLAKPPWPGTYKIRLEEKDRLTAADVVGPDGIAYPDWRYAGVPGGIPRVPVVAKIEDFGGRADDGGDDSTALQKGAEAVGRKGGGALLLGPGIYHLDRPVLITQDGVVIRGAGMEKTRLVFRYAAPPGGVGFLSPSPNSIMTPVTWIEIHAAPKGLKALRLEVDGKLVSQAVSNLHWGGTFSLRTSGASVLNKLKNRSGQHKLKATAEYGDGRRVDSEISVSAGNTTGAELSRIPSQIGAVMFAGAASTGSRKLLAQDGRRGNKEIVLSDTKGLASGEAIRLRAPATERWNTLVKNACQWGDYRRYDFRIEQVAGNKVSLNQSLRFDFPIADGSYAEKIQPIRRCGVEELSLEQVNELWTSGFLFSNAWECWARGVTVKKAGRFPLYFLSSKWCEIRDSVCDDAWYHGGGGTAYVGWEHSCDCLMENMTTYRMRHAPCVQWAASGNVIRKSKFHGSDGQWHSGWTNENLFELCDIDAKPYKGAYGYGLWASPPEDQAHGPNGPRNVVYNCTVRSPKTGLWMGGMNENWLILYNRFEAGSGPAIFARTASFDHVIRGNVFVVADPKQPALQLATADCVGIELLDNTLVGGNGRISGGAGKPSVDRQNQVKPAGSSLAIQPAVPSIFEWQRRSR